MSDAENHFYFKFKMSGINDGIKNKYCLDAIYLNSFLPHNVNNLTFQLRHNGSYSTRYCMKTSTFF